MLIYYRGAGINADVALVLNLLILVAALAYFGAVLTLPGIAGVILTVGMGVDSNVLIFERIREELRAGKAVGAAVVGGFEHAFKTIIDTHVTTVASAAILFTFGTGPIRGFAVTLTIGLPDGAGAFRIPYATEAAENPMCPSTYRSISRGPLSPAGNQWPYVEVEATLNAPAEARPGTRITYYVTLRNAGNRDYDMKPCADYNEGFNGKQFLAEYQLNCVSVSTLKPGAQVTFEMQYDVPAAIGPATRDLSWFLLDGRLAGGSGAWAPLRIT